MEYNNYISGLMSLRRKLHSRIDNEIEDIMRNRGNPEILKESLTYIIEEDIRVLTKYYNDQKAIDKI